MHIITCIAPAHGSEPCSKRYLNSPPGAVPLVEQTPLQHMSMPPAAQMDLLAAAMQRSTADSSDEHTFTAADGGSGSTTHFEDPAMRNGSSSRSHLARAHLDGGDSSGTRGLDGAHNKDAGVEASRSQRPMDTSGNGAPAPTADKMESEATARVSLMFDVGAKAAVASGRAGSMAKPSKELVHVCWKLVRKLCENHGTALSAAFGHFDQLVGLGWLIGDMVLGRLIEKVDALKVGRKAGKLGPTLEAVFAAPRKRVLGLKLVDEERRDRELAEAAKQEANLRGEPVDLPPLDEALAMPPPPPQAARAETPVECERCRHAAALKELEPAARQMRAAQQKLDDAEYSFRQLLPWPDFGQVDNLRWQLELTEPEGLSTGSERMLKRLDSALERHFNAMESMDDKVIVARERLEAVRELHLQVQLKSIRTEGDLEHAQEAERMAVMEAELDQAEQQEAVREFELSEREYKSVPKISQKEYM